MSRADDEAKLTDDDCWEAKLQWIEKMFPRMAILYIQIKGGDISVCMYVCVWGCYMKFTGSRLGRWEKANQVKSLRLDKG